MCFVPCSFYSHPERTQDDLELIYAKLRAMPPFHRLHPLLLQQLAYYGYYEDIDAGVTCK